MCVYIIIVWLVVWITDGGVDGGWYHRGITAITIARNIGIIVNLYRIMVFGRFSYVVVLKEGQVGLVYLRHRYLIRYLSSSWSCEW